MINNEELNILDDYEYQRLNIKNRIVYTDHKDISKSYVSSVKEIQEKYKNLASSGIGLIIVRDYLISEIDKIDTLSGNLSSRISIQKSRDICKAIHNFGARVIFQAAMFEDNLKWNSDGLEVGQLTDFDISRIIRGYIKRAIRIENAYADGVQLQFVKGFLLGSMFMNREDGVEIAAKIIRGIRKNLPYFPILIRIDDSISEKMLEELVEICKKREVWAIEISGNEGCLEKNVMCCRNQIKVIKSASSIPVIVTGVCNNIEKVQDSLALGADLVGVNEI